jgi:cobalt-precorrin 5A hydrolase
VTPERGSAAGSPVGGPLVSGAVTAGVGCRAGCPVEHVLAALEQELAAQGRQVADVSALYTAQFKQAEPGLLRAAQLLNKPIVSLPLGALQAQSARALTHSPHTLQRFGLPSLAETAALAGASRATPGSEPRLLGPRRVAGDATCALAVGNAPPRPPAAP